MKDAGNFPVQAHQVNSMMPSKFLLKLPRLVITSVIPEDAPDPLADIFATSYGKAVLMFPKSDADKLALFDGGKEACLAGNRLYEMAFKSAMTPEESAHIKNCKACEARLASFASVREVIESRWADVLLARKIAEEKGLGW